jgi:transposase InsO family protein
VNLYPFIEAEKAADGNVSSTCRMLEVSRAAYYEWSKNVVSRRQATDEELKVKIVKIHKASRHTYGAPRITRKLREQRICVSKKRVARLMNILGLAGRCKRRFKKTTISDPLADTKDAVDLIKRTFGPGVREIDTAWCGDITYVRTWEGWLYVATVIDLESRKVIGLAMADHMRAELVCDAIQMALEHRRPEAGLIFHSDRGSQYTSKTFRQLLDENGVIQSLSRVGQCWDNAVAESFFSTLKEELVYRTCLPTRAIAKRAIFEYVEVFYNRQRLHSSLGYMTPVQYELRLTTPQDQTQAA